MTPDIVNAALNFFFQGLSGTGFFNYLLNTFISLSFVVGSVVFLFSFLYGGILWIISGGDKEKLKNAKSRLTNSLLGLTILFSFFAIAKAVGCFLGINLLQISVGELYIGFGGDIFCR